MSVLLLTPDLACSSQVTSAASRTGAQLEVVMNLDRLVEWAAQRTPTLVILDLNTPGLDCQSLLAQLKALPAVPRTIAFGPHVHTARLDAARQAGCDEVLSRGEFYARLAQLIAPPAS